MVCRRLFWVTMMGLQLSLLCSAVAAEKEPLCTTYTATAKVIKSGNGQQYVDVTKAVQDGQYAKLCFQNFQGKDPDAELSATNGTQLLIHNTLAVPLLVENLVVKQYAQPQCEVNALSCPSLILKGPIILRNPKISTAEGVSLPLVDGIAIQADHVTIEVTPDKAQDPAYVTVKDFRTGIVVENRTGVVLDGVKIQRTATQVGSAGIRLVGPGNTVTDAQIECTDTGIHALGGAAAAPIQISGGTISAGGCTTDAGVFLQGDHAYLTDTAITGPRVGVILDPLTGPMGVKGGDINQTTVGLEVRNATPATLLALALQPDTFTAVDQLYDFTTAAASSLPSIEWSKTCAKTVTQTVDGVEQKVCDTTPDNMVTSINGAFAAEACASLLPGKMLLYTDNTSLSTTSFFAACDVPDGCHFSCTKADDDAGMTIPLNAILSPVLVTAVGGQLLEKIFANKIDDNTETDFTETTAIAPAGATGIEGGAVLGTGPMGEDSAGGNDTIAALGETGAGPSPALPLADPGSFPEDQPASGTSPTSGGTTVAAMGGDDAAGLGMSGASFGGAAKGCTLITSSSAKNFALWRIMQQLSTKTFYKENSP